jgi:hypothetical protein
MEKMNLQSPIYVTGISTDGKLLLGGIFRMQDTVGFPIDASFEECRQRGYAIDWLEALADCWLNDCLKFDSFVRQASTLTNQPLEQMFTALGLSIIQRFPKIKRCENQVDVVCRYIISSKRKKTP